MRRRALGSRTGAHFACLGPTLGTQTEARGSSDRVGERKLEMKVTAFVACLAGALACGSDAGDGDERTDGRRVRRGPVVRRGVHQLPRLVAGLRRSHGAPLSYDFDQYETARSEAAEIQLAVEEGYAATRLLALRGAEGGADRVGGVWCTRVTAARAIGVIPWADGSQGAHAIQH